MPYAAIHLHSHLSYELGENREIKYIYVLSVVGLLILLIAFINYIKITTARASVRLREVAVRKIIGSSKRNLIGLFLTESILTILSAAFITVVLVSLVMPLFKDVTGKQLSTWQVGISRTIVYMLGFSLIAGIIGGLYPAFFLARFKTIPALKNQLGNVKGQTFFRKSLVMFQFAVTVIMITASLVIYLQLNYVVNTDLGFNKKQVLTFYLDSRDVRQKIPALGAALLQNPMVKAVASAGNPIGNNNIGIKDYSVEKNGVLDEHSNLAYGLTVDADFIPAMQIKMLEARNFSTDIPSDSNDIIVNEAFIRRQGWASGMGKRISRGKDSTDKINFANIIGVVKTFTVGQRLKEIGIRKVLGASVGSMVSLLTESLLKVVVIVMLIAIPLSWLLMNKWLEDFAYRIHLEWWMFALAGIISLTIAMATLSFQAIKAAMANPVKSLRSE